MARQAPPSPSNAWLSRREGSGSLDEEDQEAPSDLGRGKRVKKPNAKYAAEAKMERVVEKLSKLAVKHPELMKKIASPQSTASSALTQPNADSAAGAKSEDGKKSEDGEKKPEDDKKSANGGPSMEPIAVTFAQHPPSQGVDDLDSSDSSSSSSSRPLSSKSSAAKRNAELASYAALDAKRKAQEITLRQITPFTETERKTLEAFIVARRARRGTRPGNGASLGVVFYGDATADAEFFDVFERFIVAHADGSSNWNVVSTYIAEYVTWFNNLAADLTNYTIPDLRDAWRGNDPRTSGTRNDLWTRAKELASPPPRPAAATAKNYGPCAYCGGTSHTFISCKARKKKLKEERAKLPKSEGGTKSDSESESSKASGSKKSKSTKKSG